MSAPPKKMGLSLYADLLDPGKSAPGATISGAPVKYDVSEAKAAAEAKKKKDASLQFQPIRRPQVQAKGKSKNAHKSSSSTTTATASSPDKQFPSSTPQQPSIQRSNFNDWVGDEEEAYLQERPKYERGGKKSKKKKNKQEKVIWEWDDIYDPSLPNNYADYKGSEEQFREIRDWKARLYYHQLKATRSMTKDSDAYSKEQEERRPMNKSLAPPANLNFAPPTFDDAPARPQPVDDDDDYYPMSTVDRQQKEERPAFSMSTVPNDATGEDAYMRRMRLSGMVHESASPAPSYAPPPASAPTPPAAPVALPGANNAPTDLAARKAAAQAKLAAIKAKLDAAGPKKANPSPSPAPGLAAPAAMQMHPPNMAGIQQAPPPPPAEPSSTISRAPVRYERPSAPSNVPTDKDGDVMMDAGAQNAGDEEKPRSSRPGQAGFAERMLQKYGWKKGQGLGAQGEGITTAIIAKAEKRKKRSDAQGGAWAQPKNMGKLVGGKRRKVESTADDDGKHGSMSEVVKLEGMLAGLDVDYEIQENNLMQEIGDEFGQNYGTVERLFIWRTEMGGGNEVFVKFTSQLSALRAVNATDGMTFADNNVAAKFFDADKFENGDYA